MTLLAGTGYNGAQALVKTLTAADGGLTTSTYDIHGDARRISDPMARITNQTFDEMGRVIQANHAGGLIDYYAYDGLGQRIKHWNSQISETKAERTFYDHQGRVTKTIAFGGDAAPGADASTGGDIVLYDYAWDASIVTTGLSSTPFGGWIQTTTYTNGKFAIEKTDMFGRATSKTDLGNLTIASTFDKAGRIVQRGSLYHYTYFNTNRLSETYRTEDQDFFNNVDAIGDAGGVTDYTYRGTTFEYDISGNVTRQKLREIGVFQGYPVEDRFEEGVWITPGPVSFDRIVSDQTATFDVLGRIISWNEAGSTTAATSRGVVTPTGSHSFKYDANSNIRRSQATFGALNAQGAVSGSVTQDYWYKYDAMDRMVTSKGKLISNAIVRDNQGIDTTYDAGGNRLTMFTPTQREDYTYDSAGRLATVKSAAGAPSTAGTLRASYSYNAMGRITAQADYESNGSTVAYSRAVTYDDKGLITSDITNTKRGSTIYRAESTYDYGTILNAKYALGAVYKITTVNFENNVQKKTNLTTNTYTWRDNALMQQAAYKPDITLSATNTSAYHYDYQSGRTELRRIAITDGRSRTVRFKLDMMSQIINRDEKDVSSGGDPHEVWSRYSGRQMGYVGNNGSVDADYAASIANRVATQGAGAFQNGSTTAVTSVDTDLAYDAVNSYEHGSNIGTYVVVAGDTLQSIAASLWGDAELWWKLAEVNGLVGDETLIEGTPLIIPAGVMRNTNNAATFQPYDPAEIIGNVAPTAPKMPKPKKAGGNCGGMGQMIVAVIAMVVVAIVAPHAIAAVANMAPGVQGVTAAAVSAGTATLSTTATMVGGAMAGATGSIVSQGVGVMTGIQDKFSWGAVAFAAIGGAIGGSGSKLGVGGTSDLSNALRHGVANAITQGVGIATGLQKDFSWAGVAAASVGSYAAAKAPGSPLNVVRNGASMIASAATRSLIEGTNFGDNVMAALPDVIGQTVGEMVAGAPSDSSAGKVATPKQDLVAGLCGEGYISAFDASSGPIKSVKGVEPIDIDSDEFIVIGTRRSLVDRISGAIGDFFGADGQVFYDGYSHERQFSLRNFVGAWSDVNAFALEYVPFNNPYFNTRGDAARTYGAIAEAGLDIAPSVGRGFDNFLNGDLIGTERAQYWAGGIREQQAPVPSLGEVLAELTGIPSISRARDELQAVEYYSRIGNRTEAVAHAKGFLWEGGNVALAATGYGVGGRAIATEMTAARVADAAAIRHAAWARDVERVSATVERLGHRALMNSGNNWQTSERLFEGYLEAVNNRLVRSGSDFTVAVQPAAKSGERVSAFVARGGRNFPNPGSVRLDAGVTTMALPVNKGGFRPIVAGFDITLNRLKPNIVRKYQDHFGSIPIYDIRLP